MSQLVVNGTLINYIDSGGNKPVVICIHGWLHNVSSYRELTPLLTPNYRVIAVDLPNFGKSESTESVTAIHDYAKILADFISKLDIDKYILIGHSMGGQIVIAGIGRQLLKPQKLILIASSGIRRQSTKKQLLMNLSKQLKPVVPTKIKNKFYRHIGSDYSTELSPILKSVISNALSTDVSKDARNITVPTLLIYGDKDTSTPVWIGKEIARLIPKSQLEIISGGDHWVHQKIHTKVAEYILRFIDA